MSITAHAVPPVDWRRGSRFADPSQILASRTAQFLALLAFAVLIRWTAWGEWNFDIDEQFYALVGDRLAHGDLLYVDIWDRKGPALYLTFALFSLYEAREWSGYDKTAELRKILAGRPQTVVVQRPLPASPLDPVTVALVEDYVQGCSRVRGFTVYDHDGPQRQVVYSGCGDVARADTNGGAKRAGIG